MTKCYQWYLLGGMITGDFLFFFILLCIFQFSTTECSYFNNLKKNNKCYLKRIKEGENDWGILDLGNQKWDDTGELSRRQAT